MWNVFSESQFIRQRCGSYKWKYYLGILDFVILIVNVIHYSACLCNLARSLDHLLFLAERQSALGQSRGSRLRAKGQDCWD